ncbi:MAG: class I SAM-dependent methyltransferase [Solirubrobacterales bacterium]
MDLDEYREKSLESWDRFAGNWVEERDYVSSKTRPVSEALIAGLAPQPGEAILELAAGTGDLGFEVVKRLGDDGRLVQTDFAPGMVGAARRASEERGLINIDHRVLDAERVDLDDASFDGALCRFGYMLMADPAAALAETRRVLREGGRLAFAVWTSPDQNKWAFLPGLVMVELGHMAPPEPGAPGIFAMGDPNRIRELVTGAGFDEPTIEQVPVSWNYADTAEHWEKTLKLAAPIAEAFNSAPPEEQDRIRTTVAERVEPLLGGDEAPINGLVHIVRAE